MHKPMNPPGQNDALSSEVSYEPTYSAYTRKDPDPEFYAKQAITSIVVALHITWTPSRLVIVLDFVTIPYLNVASTGCRMRYLPPGHGPSLPYSVRVLVDIFEF